MSILDALANWATGFVTAAVVAALSLGSSGAPVVSPSVATDSGILAWAQGVDEQTVQQVGEEAQAEDADAESLDAGSPPAENASSSDGEVVVEQPGDDVELLDQGTPPQEATTATSVGMAPVETSAPATAYESSAPAPAGDVVVTESTADTGPRLPEGFGEGQVLVSTAAGDFPPGLDECHVGAVTGRAYVGLECDEEGSTFVGHAPTFEDFPFVTDENFPFENDDPIVADENFPFGDDGPTPAIELSSDSETTSNVYVAAGGRREGPSVSLPVGSEGAVIERAQRDRDDSAAGQSDKKNKRNRSTSISVDASSGSSNDRVQSASKDSNESKQAKNASGKEKNNKSKHKQKAKDNKKNKKANKNSKSDDNGKKGKKDKKENRKKN